uniref:SLC26A/SulP transporter domain-containing protein n=1 Tax=Timema tahoe TaxID=61484 RepID=A0A7R9IPQ3_9NEOP|nr:unnamed protein product [Timema tahoe]
MVKLGFESQLVTAEPAKDGMKDLQSVTSKGKQLLLRHVSIFRWLPHYTKLDAVGDLVAGVTLGLTMMPQAIAYASLAGLSAQYGLYSSFMGGLVYMMFGTIKEVSIGITSLMALMTYEYTQDLPVEFVILLTFLSGCVQLMMGLLDLGILVDFISEPVTSGFTTATSLIIIVSQMKGLLGLRFKSNGFVDNIWQLFKHAGEAKLWDCQIKPGLPTFGLPPFSAQVGNTTYSFLGMCEKLGSGIIMVPVVGVLANVAIAKAFSAGKSLDATQEMLTLGMCNLFGSFVQSTPTTGAFTRSAVSNASGVKTPMGGLYSGTIILLALGYLTPYFYFIPRCTLAAVLITAVMFMIDFKIMIHLWKCSKRDLFALLITLVSSLMFGVEVGLLMGAVFNMMQLLYLWARPITYVKLCKSEKGCEYVLVTPDLGLVYSSLDYLRTELGKAAVLNGRGKLPVVLNCAHFKRVDYTAACGIKLILKDFTTSKQPLLFLNAQPSLVHFLQSNNINTAQYGNSEEEIVDILLGEQLDLTRSETLPFLGKSQELKVSVDDENILFGALTLKQEIAQETQEKSTKC